MESKKPRKNGGTPGWFPLSEYASRRHLRLIDVKGFCKEGMPCMIINGLILIDPKDSDPWIKMKYGKGYSQVSVGDEGEMVNQKIEKILKNP